MNAVDDIRIRAGAASVSDAEALEVIAWCREWAADCEWGDIGYEDVSELPIPDLLRGCARWVDGGIAFVLADVRRCLVAS